MQNNDRALTQELADVWSWFFAFGQMDINNLFDSVHLYGCGQAHPGVPKVIPNIESTLY